MTISQNIVDATTTLRDAMATLNTCLIKLCLVVDDQGAVQRTLTDGDIRRALLKGWTIDDPTGKFVACPFVHVLESAAQAEIVRCFEDNPAITALVVVDTDGKPVDLVARSTLQAPILLSPPHMGKAESEYVKLAFDDNWIAPAGPNLVAFEAALSKVSGCPHTLALSSGTAALHLALRVLNAGEGDPVYVSDLTFAATVQPVLYEQAVPVLIDSDPDTWNMSPRALGRRLAKDAAKGQLPKAIIVVHLYGQSANMAAIMELADSYHVPVIEDAAESLGATYRNRPSGSHGVLAAYSFNGNKIITTSGGGALVGHDQDLIDRARILATQGRDVAEHYQHSQIAYNYRMSNVLAGIGMGQLEILNDRVAQRRQIFARYQDGLSDLPGIRFQAQHQGSDGNRWLTVLTLDADHIDRHPYQLMRQLQDMGIESRPAWKPMHMQPLLAQYALEPHSEDDIVASRLFLQSLCLPSGSSLTEKQQDQIIQVIRDFAKGL